MKNKFIPTISSLQENIYKYLPTILDPKKLALSVPYENERLNYQFFRIDEMSEVNAKENRLALGNMIAGALSASKPYNLVYLLSGKPEGVSLYIGLVSNEEISTPAQQLFSAFEGNFAGAKLSRVDENQLQSVFEQSCHLGVIQGVPSEDENPHLENDTQGVERLINALSGETWQMAVIVEVGEHQEIENTLCQLCDDISELSKDLKRSVQYSQNRGSNTGYSNGVSESENRGNSRTLGSSESVGFNESQSLNKTTNTSKSKSDTSSSSYSTSETAGESSGSGSSKGTSRNQSTNTSESTNFSQTRGTNKSYSKGTNQGESRTINSEQINKRAEMLFNYWNEIQIPRFQQGLGKGMYRTAIYLCAENESVFDRLSQNVVSIYQGNRPTLYPLTIGKLNIKEGKRINLRHILQIRQYNDVEAIRYQHNIPYSNENGKRQIATWLTAQELSLLMGLPNREVSGLKLRKNVSFAINTVENETESISLGHIVQDGRILKNKPISLAKHTLDKHIFISGVTGAGKTTTCMKLLLASQMPFTVIEPAKTEYRALYAKNNDICYYALGNEALTTFRLNPFELISKEQNLLSHIGMLKATLTAVFPMEASMPQIVEQAIRQAYEKKGWDISLNLNYFSDDPWNDEENFFPTFSDMIAELDNVINAAKMGAELSARYRGSLVSRLQALTMGVCGTMINTPRSINFDKLLDQNVIFELDELKDEADKAFMMGLIIGRLVECIKQRHQKDNQFKHMTLIEEAHRLLAEPGLGEDGAKKLGVSMFANLLAEVRKYGECLVIADQIPKKLVSDVIKNTNTKIVHRLFSADDCDVIGNAIGLNADQKGFLPQLQVGETIIYSGGWHAAVRAQIDQIANTTGNAVSNDVISQQGKKQLWQQRDTLFPHLAKHTIFTEQNFAEIVRSLREQITIAMNLLNWSQKTSDIGILDRIWQRFVQKVRKMESTFSITTQMISSLWLAMLQDCDVYDFTHQYAFEGNKVLFERIFCILVENIAHPFSICQEVLQNDDMTKSSKRLEIFYVRYFL